MPALTAGLGWITTVRVCSEVGGIGGVDMDVSWMGLDLMVGGDDRDMLRWSACPKAVNFGVA